MPQYWQVTFNGVTLFKGLRTRQEADARAERWQGERYKRGLLKHGDKGDHIEVKPDVDTAKDFDTRYADWKAGKPQRIVMEEYLPD